MLVAPRCGARPRQSRAAGRRTRCGLPLTNDSFYRDERNSSRFYCKSLLGGNSFMSIIRRMASTEFLRAMTEEEIGREIVRLVPQWYEADCGPEQRLIPIGNYAANFHHHASFTPNLAALFEKMCARTRELQVERFMEYPGVIDVIVESLAIEWLRMHAKLIDWVRLLNYLETVARRTHENLPVALTLVICSGTGQGDITQPRLQRFFDRLAASPFTFTYLAVDSDLQLLHYGSVEWSQVNNAASRRFYPEFLHPIHCAMKDDDLVAHVTARGELVVMNKAGVLATKRKKKWRIYDAQNLASSLSCCLGNRDTALNLLEVVFDLSFRHKSALSLRSRKECVATNPEPRKHPVAGLAPQRPSGSSRRKWAGSYPSVDRRHCPGTGRRDSRKETAID